MTLSAIHFKVAWREISRRFSEHSVYVAVIALGVSSLIATSSFTDSLADAIELQTKSLLGADFVVKSRQELPFQILEKYDSEVVEFSDQTAFNSMVQFLSTGETRLVQVRSVSGSAPYYGVFETNPPQARASLNEWQPNSDNLPPAIVDSTLLLQFDASVGDTIRLGSQDFVIKAELVKVAGEIAAVSVIGPRIYIPQSAVAGTGLLEVGSLSRHKRFYRSPDPKVTQLIIARLKDELLDSAAEVETVEDRKEDLQDLLGKLKVFLGISGVAALLLGLAGVASASFVQARRKRPNAAALMCIGARKSDVALIYGLQSALLAAFGAVLGSIIAWFILHLFPLVLLDFLPLDISVSIHMSPWALFVGAAVGLIGGLLFSWEALRALTLTSPMQALRTSYLQKNPRLSFATLFVAALYLLLAGRYATGNLLTSLTFLVGTAAAIIAIVLSANVSFILLRKTLTLVGNSIVRQGLANVLRPNNQSTIMVLCIALLTFILSLTLLLQRSLLDEVALKDTAQQPNTILFDVQSDQIAPTRSLLARHSLPVLEESAVVSMRLRSVDGKLSSELLKDKSIPKWTLRREYRSTYRDYLSGTERIIRGKLVKSVKNPNALIPVSLEEGIAEKLKVDIGSTLIFDVQGVELKTVVTSIREVDWKQVRPNFFVVFPLGVLEKAPQMTVFATRTSDSGASALLQRETVKLLPNVSVIDITLVLDTLTAVIDKISFVIMFLGFFIAAMGAVVLGGALATGRYHRIRELVIYRLLGASFTQMRCLAASEFIALGFTGVVIGLLLSFSTASLLAAAVLKVSLHGKLFSAIIPATISILLVALLGAVTTGPFRKLAPKQVLSS
ncbi:MAG: ABC transporter permease [Bdellovibrionales bacterium]|nr:ABC transporter permease [Bdellovibrionales bacterium]